MTPEQLTLAAAQKCADLTNNVSQEQDSSAIYNAIGFAGIYVAHVDAAFRRFVEHIDARDREALFLLEKGDTHNAKAKLRADLLPEPETTLLEEFMAAHPNIRNEADLDILRTMANWIANREVKP